MYISCAVFRVAGNDYTNSTNIFSHIFIYYIIYITISTVEKCVPNPKT